MSIFRKNKTKEKEKKEKEAAREECWYNNSHESTESKLGEFMDDSWPASPNWLDFATTNKIAKK